MSVGPLAGQIAASAAGTSLAQSQGPDAERAQHASNVQKRTFESQLKAEAAAGIGETDTDDTRSNDRDADGRQAWKWQQHHGNPDDEDQPASKDPSGQTGNLLDLSG